MTDGFEDGPLATSGPFRRGWYRGDCHVHSTLSSGGELTPDRLAADAVAAGLDFIATTEHNTAEGHGNWAAVAGDLLVILGQEVTTRTGHWVALGLEPGQALDWQYGLRDDAIDDQLERVHRVGGLCVAVHPFAPYPSGTFMYPYEGFDLVEVWNGRCRSDLPWNADEPAVARVAVRGVPSGVVSLHTDRGLAHRRDLPGDGAAVVEWQTTVAESAFVRVEVRHPDRQMAALTNPIQLT